MNEVSKKIEIEALERQSARLLIVYENLCELEKNPSADVRRLARNAKHELETYGQLLDRELKSKK